MLTSYCTDNPHTVSPGCATCTTAPSPRGAGGGRGCCAEGGGAALAAAGSWVGAATGAADPPGMLTATSSRSSRYTSLCLSIFSGREYVNTVTLSDRATAVT